MPKRIQRKRTKGWRMPPNTVSICRPGKFGNPFSIDGAIRAGYGKTADDVRQMCIDTFRDWLVHGEKQFRFQGNELIYKRRVILNCLKELHGKDLACFCKEGEPCHGDVLLEMANK